MLVTLIGCTILSACGGGDGSAPAAAQNLAAPSPMAVMPPEEAPVLRAQVVETSVDSAVAELPAALDDAVTQATPFALTASADVEVINAAESSTRALVLPPRQTASAAPIGVQITTVGVENTGLIQLQVPVTFGQAFAAGDVPTGYTVSARLPDGSMLPLQVDAKATHADGSLRHAVLSTLLPRLGLLQTQQIALVKTLNPNTVVARPPAPATLLDSGMAASVSVMLNNQVYSFSPAAALRSGNYTTWLSGQIVQEWTASGPLTTVAGVDHPHLTARVALRWYPGATKKARVEVVVENNKTFAPAAQNFTYDVNVNVAGRVAFSETALTHLHHARWRKVFWWDPLSEPKVHVRHSTPYLISTKAVPNYDSRLKIPEGTLAAVGKQATAANSGPMKVGPVTPYMPTTGGRGDIGPLPAWTVTYLMSMDRRAYATMMAAAEGAATWSIHYRDEKTGYPLRLDNPINRQISTHPNMASRGPLPVPRCADNDRFKCGTAFSPDTAHQPSLVYLPYLLTGENYYLDELHFWAASNPLETDAGNRGFELGLLRFQQVRAQAWSMRTLGHAAYITPDQHPLKAYWNSQLNNNLDYYYTEFVTKNPNKLGVYDGGGVGMFKPSMQPAPWQDDFLTWSFGYLAELGFNKAKPIFDWKAKYAVGRMTAPGFCWTEGAAYILAIRPALDKPVFNTFAEVYAYQFRNGMTNDEMSVLTHPTGIDYRKLPCGGQEQADWRTKTGKFVWVKGRMLGYSDSVVGYPANMQPALALAAGAGLPDAQKAWNVFDQRAAKPDYNWSPTWAIVPR